MNEIRDLLYTSLNAQFDYIFDRYNNKKDLQNFENASQFILSCIDGVPSYDSIIFDSFCINYDETGFDTKVAQDCLELYRETRDLLLARFVVGRATEYVLERL